MPRNWIDDLSDDALARAEARAQPLSAVTPEPVDWLWPGFVPKGMVTVLWGEEGLGKSQLLLWLLAGYSRGEFSAGELEPGRPGGHAMLYGAEDPLKQVVVPRLMANGANLNFVFSEGVEAETWLPEGIGDVNLDVGTMGLGLIGIDPLIAYFGRGVSANNPQDVRGVLRGLAAVAERTGATFVCVMHPKKGQEARLGHMIAGSAAFGQAARSVLGVALHPDCDPNTGCDQDGRSMRVVGRTKGNLDLPPQPVAFEILPHTLNPESGGREIHTSRIELHGLMPDGYDHDGAMRGQLRGPDDTETRDAQAEAEDFLRQELIGRDRVASTEVNRDAQRLGIARRTLMRARRRLGVVAEQEDGQWWMTLAELPSAGGDKEEK